MNTNLDNYRGSRILEGLTSYTSLDVDQLNFLVSQFVALGLAGLYRTILGPTQVSPKVRHCFGLILGLWMGYFCFGYQAVHLAGLPAVCYLIILTQDPHIVHGAVLFAAMLYLSCIHLQRQFFEDVSYGLDISGSLMVITQKVTSFAFSLRDGMVKKEVDMTESQKHYAIRKVPSVVEFFSYSLMFPSLMAGPVIFYKDYMDFIEGHSLPGCCCTQPSSSTQTVIRDPSPVRPVIRKTVLASICAAVFVIFLPRFPIVRVKEPNFVDGSNVSYKFWYLSVTTTLFRFKYYFAWTLADAICNNAGLGFSGYNDDGSSEWNKFSNVDIFQFEFGTSLKQSIDAWNKGTNKWLKFLVYERLKNNATVLTYALSALWHGFYPGYYLTFFSGALFTFASRIVRRCLRGHFMFSSESRLLYDLLTFCVTRFVMAYITFPFVLLEFWSSIAVYNRLYWMLHVMAVAAIWLTPKLIPKAVSTENAQKSGIAEAIKKAESYSDAVGRID